MDELPIGRRVAYWRNRRRMSQQMFADRLGKSKSWVDKVERGVRKLDKFSVVSEVADVLCLDVRMLMGSEPERRADATTCVDQIEITEVRAALERYDRTSVFSAVPRQPPQMPALRQSTAHAWQMFQHARYGALVRSLPRLLREAQAADAAYASGGDATSAAHLLAQVYQIASSVLRKLGELDLAWLCADRAVGVSQRADDVLLTGTAAHRVGTSLLALGRARPALEVTVASANQLAPGTAPSTPQRLSIHGSLLLQGAMAAARIGDRASVHDLIAAAAEVAEVVGEHRNHYWTCFGPTNAQLHLAAASVELGEGGLAIRTHEAGIDPAGFAGLLPERRAHHYLDMARAFLQVGELERAGEMLLAADHLAPAEIRCRPVAHAVLAEVLRRGRGTPIREISELSQHLGVGV